MAGEHPAPDNIPTFTVSEIGQAVKRKLEDSFERVRIRGEISRPSFPASGHCYFRMKDESAVIDAVIWRGVRRKLRLTPEDGMEVIATGKVTAYAGKSSYQIMVDSLELAGEGALLKLLEERRKKLAAEGLFAEATKRPLPYLPEVVGIVTSPTGAVIRDILHRLGERFPRRVVLWPVSVQGERAAPEVAAAIQGFNALDPAGAVPRPDVLIVARGGGSLEDLWAFNEEVVVRAAAASTIPLISAVGHETDTTLIDHAADRRAPTPTAAAEVAVPVKSDLIAQVTDFTARLALAIRRYLHGQRESVTGLGHRLPHPRQQIQLARERLGTATGQLDQAARRRAEKAREAELRLDAERRLNQSLAALRRQVHEQIDALGRILEGYSYKKTLERGFAVVHSGDQVVTAAEQVRDGDRLTLEWHDGTKPAVAGESGHRRRKRESREPTVGTHQHFLFDE